MAVATRVVSPYGGIKPSFEEEWPELARRLDRLLAGRGVEVWLREDVIQETATRVYSKWSRFDHARPLWNLVVTIALGILVDERRRSSRTELVSDVPQSTIDDVERRAVQRVYLRRTRAALERLRGDERRVLLAEIGEAAALDGSRNRINVLRSRARAGLREAVGPWAPSAIALRLRHLRARIAHKRSIVEGHAPAMATSLVNVVVAATLSLAGNAGGGGAVGGSEVGGSDVGGVPVVRRAPGRPDVVSMADLRDILDPAASIRRAEPSRSTLQDHAEKGAQGPPGLIADPKQWADYQREWVEDKKDLGERRARYVKGNAEEQAEDKKELGEKRAKYVKAKAEEQAEDKKDLGEERAEYVKAKAKEQAERTKG